MPELIEVDPGTLIIGANIRTKGNIKLDKPFIASIAEHGVKQPIQAYRDTNLDLVVVDGQRRTMAAMQTLRPIVKVEVVAKPTDADRIVDQITVTEHREGNTQADRMNAIAQLSLFGLPASEIAKKTGHAQPVVKAAITAAANPMIASAVVDHELDLLDAAAIEEFADEPDVAAELISYARNGNLKWQLQRARDDREARIKRAAAVEAATAAGIKILDGRPDTYNGPIAQLSDLTDAAGKTLTPAKHKTCPGHAAFIEKKFGKSTYTMAPTYVCTDFKKHKHTPTGYRATTAAKNSSPEGKADQRVIRAGNRDWVTATGLRRTWLREQLAARSAPATAAAFIALSLADDAVVADARTRSHSAMAQYLLGVVDEPKRSGLEDQAAFVEMVSKASERRAVVITLGIVLGAYESALTGFEWRSTTYPSSKPTLRYLRYLQVCGYELTPIELQACGEQPTAAADVS